MCYPSIAAVSGRQGRNQRYEATVLCHSLLRSLNADGGSPLQENREHFKMYIRDQFQKSKNLSKKDFAAIEYLLRKGGRQLELYGSPGVRDIKLSR